MEALDIIQIERTNFYNKDVSLRNRSVYVTDFGDDFQKEVDTLVNEFRKWKIAVGLSAPQIGIFKRFSKVTIDKFVEYVLTQTNK